MLDEKRYAVLIDADNISAKYIKCIIDEISSDGVVTYKRIYADWTTSNNNHWKDVLLEYSINPIQQYRYTTGKNSSDSALIIDAMDILYSDKIDGFCLVSSDSDFTKLATRLRESGMQVIGMGEQKTPKPFVSACNKFKYLDVLVKADEEKKSEPTQTKIPTSAKEKPEKAMTSAETILSYIVKTITDLGDDDFGMNIGNLGHQITKMHPDFDTRYFGHSKFSKFLEELGLKVVINQTKQMVYLSEDLIPENEKPINNQVETPVLSKPNTNTSCTKKDFDKKSSKLDKKTEPQVKINSVPKSKIVVQETQPIIEEKTHIEKIVDNDTIDDDCYFNKTPIVEEKKVIPPKISKKSIDSKTKNIIADILLDSSKLGIGLNLDYVFDLIVQKDPTFSLKRYGFNNSFYFFKSLDFIQTREIRDGGELLYLKAKFLNQYIKSEPVAQIQETVEHESKIEVESTNSQFVEKDSTEKVANTKDSSLFKITKLQNGIPSDKQAMLTKKENENRIVTPQKINLSVSETSNNESESDIVKDSTSNLNETDIVPEFTYEFKEKVRQEIQNILKNNIETGIYIGTLGKIITDKFPEFDVRGFGFTKLSSFLKHFNFVKLKSKNMSRRNIWAYLNEECVESKDISSENNFTSKENYLS